ncbi:MAG: Ribosome-binding factor A [Opitutia bacterium UBA7350]|nr:MAG: Ribosome-binding factor A [Opitutae bacterium UBA7350]
MSKRITRVNELLQREISEQLHQRYQVEATSITISSVETSNDLRSARIYYSVIGESDAVEKARVLFRRVGRDLRDRVRRRVILKYFPNFEFCYDASMERGAYINELLDEMKESDIHE